MEYAYSNSELTISGAYVAKNRYGDVVPARKLGDSCIVFIFYKGFVCVYFT